MVTGEFWLRLLAVTLWPLVVIVAILVVRPHLSALLGGAKVKIAVAGQSIETTFKEVQEIVYIQTAEPLTSEQYRYLERRQLEGPDVDTQSFRDETKQAMIRPLRNQGLILASPRDVYLSGAKAIEISGLGRLYLRARSSSKPA